MATFDDEPSLWITRSSVVHYVVEALHHHGVPVAGSVDFRQLSADARNRNSRWEPKEWWDGNDLKKIDVSNNEIEEVPEELENQVQIEHINLNTNLIKVLPSSMFQI